jgi:SAM-dependent methyltransferase
MSDTNDAVNQEESALEAASDLPDRAARSFILLFLTSFVALYFELVVIRYLSTEIRVFAYLKNLALIASFFGIGLGMLIERPPRVLKQVFPWIAAVLFTLITFAPALKLTHLPVPASGYLMFTTQFIVPGNLRFLFAYVLFFLLYLAVISGFIYLVVAFFTVLGGMVGEHLKSFPSLLGYGVNLAGSLAGIAAFTALSFLGLPPVIWILIGFLALVPFYFRQRLALAVFALIVGVMAIPQPHTYWSPYYRITLTEVPPPTGWPHPAAYFVDVNHDYHQKMLDLSPEFTARFPNAEPNLSGRPTYELPYRLVPNPGRVLVVGAGTGNDVAAALRHGATHVDAVEIDPFILGLGRKYHPEHPYDSPRVSVFVDDARAFFKKTTQKYDLIVFAYLDSHTMVTGFSSIRLDNYVYTLESFREARSLLRDNGTLVLAFGGGKTFISDRLFGTLAQAFDAPPRAYATGYDTTGVVFVEGKAADSNVITDFPEVSEELQSHQGSTIVATDHWPFLYLSSRTLPVAIWSILVLFLFFATVFLKREVPLRRLATYKGRHLFFLGAGFMLLETKGVTELSLLFGSTWIVNAVVIAGFLVMGLLANTFIMFRPISRRVAYAVLFTVLALGMFVPYSLLGALPSIAKVLASATLAGLPVLFSGLIFSRSFRDVTRPSQALGINLLGAVVGGVLENLVMIGGTPILGIAAFLLYGLSAAFIPTLSPEIGIAGASAGEDLSLSTSDLS